MTVRAPGMEGEQGSQHTESQEDGREENALHLGRYLVVDNFKNIHGLCSGTVVDTQDSDEQEGRSTHQHQRQLHGGIFLLSASPYSDEQVHRNQSHFVEHEHGEQVGRNEESEHSDAQQGKPKEVFSGHGFQLPGSEGSGKDNDGTQQQHDYGDSVDSYRVADMEGCIPGNTVSKKHLFRSTGITQPDVGYGEICGQQQEQGRTCHHYSTDLVHVAGHPQSQQHQQGY